MSGDSEVMLLEVLFVNDQTNVYINEAALKDVDFFNGIKPSGNKFPSKLNLNSVSRYFHGPVLSVEISCDYCGQDEDSSLPIHFINRVKKFIFLIKITMKQRLNNLRTKFNQLV
jgi:hypothetical protein